MEDVFKELGLRYADSMPVEIAGVLVPLVVIAFLCWKVYDSDVVFRTGLLIILAGLAVAVLLNVPLAIGAAKSHCRALYTQSHDSGDLLRQLDYRTSNCSNVWPFGPDS